MEIIRLLSLFVLEQLVEIGTKRYNRDKSLNLHYSAVLFSLFPFFWSGLKYIYQGVVIVINFTFKCNLFLFASL